MLLSELLSIWERHRVQPLVWGVSDCAVFAAECMRAKSGVDIVEPSLLSYRCEMGALRSVHRSGHRSVEEYLDKRLLRIEVGMADIGDLLYFGESGVLNFPAVVLGERCVSKGVSGPVVMMRALATHGYSVPWRS